MKRPSAPDQTFAWNQRNLEIAGLLGRIGLGDRAALGALYERTSSHLFAVVLRINRDRAEAEDILQEVYVNVWRAASSFDVARSQPLTWLTSVARNRAIDSLRRGQTRPQTQLFGTSDGAVEAEEASVYDTIADDAPGPLELLSRAADERELAACMDGLNALQRQSVALAFYHGLSHAEVAEQMRQPLGTVKSWVRRALLALRRCLQSAVERDAGSEAGVGSR
jgi:RNA polymerase sigma-70 factor (ECF subfamily)